MNFIEKNKNILAALVLFTIVCTGFFAHLNLFSQTEYVNGTDGGFYAFRVRELVEDGVFPFSITGSPPVIFLTSAFFAKFFGVFDGVKIATALYSVLLGVSIFILTKYITKSRKAGLIAAFFAIFSPMSLRVAADIRKNTAALFFMPLIFYFMLKLFDDLQKAKSASNWKYVIPLAIVGVLGILSHNSIITIWFVSLAYFALYFGLKWFDSAHHRGKLEMREFIPVFAVNLLIVVLTLLFYDKISSNLETIAAPPGPLSQPMFEELNTYILPLAVVAVPGILLAFWRRTRKDILLLSWLLLLFLLTLSQAVGPSEYWRFILIMFVPITIFVGYSFDWLMKRLRYIAVILLVAVAIIATQQFFEFGRTNPQMTPQLNEQILGSLQKAADRIERDGHVYTSAQHHPYFWVRYFFGINSKRFYEDSLDKFNDLINEGNDVYYTKGSFDMDVSSMNMPPEEMKFEEPPKNVKGEMEEHKPPMDFKPDGFKTDDFEPDPALQEKYLETVYKDEDVTVFKLKSAVDPSDVKGLIRPAMREEDVRPERTAYDFSRLRYLSTYLILPYEIINIINPPYLPLWQIQLGLPLSLLIIGFAASLLLKIKLKSDLAKFLVIAIGVALVFVIYGLKPSIFWGAKSPFVMEPPGPPGPEGPQPPSKEDQQYNWSTMTEGPYRDRVSYATSTDLLHWTDSGKTLAEHASVPDAIYKDGMIYLYFVDVTQDGKPEQLGLLRSKDKGQTWLPKTFITIEDLGDKAAVDPDPFLLPDGRIRLYYFDITVGFKGESGKIYSAISDDGINFVEEEGVRFEREEGLFDPDVIKVGDTYRMYVGDEIGQNVISAISSDGLTFTEEGLAYSGRAVPNVFYDGEKYILYTAGIEIAFSNDGKTFTKQEYSFRRESGLTADAGVIQVGENQYLMFYKTRMP